MSEFTYLFRGRETAASPEQMQKTMEKWVAWFKELGAKGHIKDTGHPLEHTGKVVKGKQKIVNDGPYAEAKDVVGGYVVIEATDIGKKQLFSGQLCISWRYFACSPGWLTNCLADRRAQGFCRGGTRTGQLTSVFIAFATNAC